MESTTEGTEQINVIKMDREELLTFFYNYIKTGTYIERHNTSISQKLETNRQERAYNLTRLNRNYDSFYSENLLFYETKVKEKLSDKNSFRNKPLTLKNIPIYIKTLFFLFIFLLLGLNSSSIVNSVSAELVAMIIGGIILALIFSFIFPALFLIWLPLLGLFSLLYRILIAVVKNVMTFTIRVYNKYTLVNARKKDILSAEKKGITKANIMEVFKYEQIKDEINYKYDELEKKIKTWNFDEKNNTKTQHQQLSIKIPTNALPSNMDDQKLDYVIYMYNQLLIGANDNWKESINDLKLQIRHDQTIHNQKQLINSISESNNNLVKMNQDICNKISGLSSMITAENNKLNSRMDGVYDRLESYYY